MRVFLIAMWGKITNIKKTIYRRGVLGCVEVEKC